jgi:predicted Zn-dependent protease with MMP-like domain
MTDWTNAKSPSLDDFERIAREAFAALPARFRDLVDGVTLAVQEFPDGDVDRDLELESPFDLLGLFQGAPLAARDGGISTPTMIFLYRRPILDYWSEHDETLGSIVRHVIIHEIGHHFGLSDADMDRIEASA